MPLRMNRNRQGRRAPATAGGTSRLWALGRAIVCIVALLAPPAPVLLNSQQPAGGEQQAPRSVESPAANGKAEASGQTAMSDDQAKKVNVEPANVERKRQVSDYSADLLKLATDLKAEVDKTSKDTLSLGVIRKADEIERLTHQLKDKMKPGTNATN